MKSISEAMDQETTFVIVGCYVGVTVIVTVMVGEGVET